MLCKLICAGVFSIPLIVSASAGVYKCYDAAAQLRSAKDQFQFARSNADDNARKYANCVEASNGRADCNVEFLRLKSDQDDLESAVSEYKSALSNFLECDHSRPAAPSRNDLGQLKALILRVILRTRDIPAGKILYQVNRYGGVE